MPINNNNAEEIRKWLLQAEHDYKMAKNIIEDGGYDTCAFLCQQAVEKHFKALFIYRNNKYPPKTHYLDELAKELLCPNEILDIAKELSADYMISRYPDAGGALPYEEYSFEDAEHKIKIAGKAIEWIKGQIK